MVGGSLPKLPLREYCPECPECARRRLDAPEHEPAPADGCCKEWPAALRKCERSGPVQRWSAARASSDACSRRAPIAFERLTDDAIERESAGAFGWLPCLPDTGKGS